jgi:hypothetical protein
MSWSKEIHEYTSAIYDKCFLGITLCEDGYYRLGWCDDSDAFTMGYPLSEGYYEIINDTIILNDVDTDLKLIYLFDTCCIKRKITYYPFYYEVILDSCIKPLKTYPFMKDVTFNDYYKRNCNYNSYTIAEIPVAKVISDSKKLNSKENQFEEGVYKYFMPGSRLEIQLKDDKKYALCFINEQERSHRLQLDISSGTWNREGNIIKLWDTNLEHQFYGLVREDGIVLLLSRWWNDCVFKRE